QMRPNLAPRHAAGDRSALPTPFSFVGGVPMGHVQLRQVLHRWTIEIARIMDPTCACGGGETSDSALPAELFVLQLNGYRHRLRDDVEDRRVLLSDAAQFFQLLSRHVRLDPDRYAHVLKAVAHAFGEPEEAVEIQVPLQAGLDFCQLDPACGRMVD